MEVFNDFLKQFPLYTPQAFEEIKPYLSYKTIGEGEFLLQSGKICAEIAFIEKGMFRQYYLNDGKEVTNCFCKENMITTSFTSLITRSKSAISIQAIESSKVLVFSYHSLQKLYEKNLFWQQLGRLASEKEFVSTEFHNRFLRDYSATDRYNRILEEESELLQRVPLKYLATYLQIAPETLSRIRKKKSRT